MYVNKHCVFHCSKSNIIHGGMPVQIIIYLSITKGLYTLIPIIKQDLPWLKSKFDWSFMSHETH
jgi:hypothetical protein